MLMHHITPTVSLSYPQLSITIVAAYHIYPTFLSIFATLTLLHQTQHMLQQTTRFPPKRNRSPILIGLSIHLGVGILHPPSLLAAFSSTSNLLATSTSLDMCNFCEFTSCNHLFSSRDELLHHLQVSGNNLQIHGYLIHSLHFKDSNATSTFWQLQSTIATQQ